MKKAIISISLFIGLTAAGVSQSTDQNLILFAKYTESGVKLKVAPQTASTWIHGAENGYNFYRREEGTTDFTKVNSASVLPLQSSDIVQILGAGNDSLITFQENSVFEQIRVRKNLRSPFETVRYEQEFNKNYSFYFLLTTRVSEISRISGLEFTDVDIAEGRSYEYKVEMINANPEEDVAVCQVYTDTNTAILPILQAYEGEKVIDLVWSQIDDSPVLSYFVERSKDSITFSRLNEAPIYLNRVEEGEDEAAANSYNKLMYHKDSLDQNYQPYVYRLIGLDVWGEETSPSLPMTFMGRDRTAPPLPDSLWVEAVPEEMGLKLNWSYDSQPSDLSGVLVFHADSSDGVFTPVTEDLLAADTRQSLKENVIPGSNHYFQLVVSDTAGNYKPSRLVYGFLPDIYPPEAPTDLNATIDSLGVVTLTWKKNSEADIRGYAIYRTNGSALRFIKISDQPVQENSFIDTLSLNRLNKESLYAVMALDNNYNYSEYSEYSQVQIPDTLPPAAPGLLVAEMASSQLSLKWAPSVSNDIGSQHIYSCDHTGLVLDTLASIPAADSSYSLSWDQTGTFYFSIQVEDNDGNSSDKSSLTSLVIQEAENIFMASKLKVRSRQDGFQLTWDVPANENLASRIYRKPVGGQSRLLTQLNEQKYTDKDNLPEGEYYYYICLVDASGVMYMSSEMVKIKR